jgi:hypothetical protein
MTDVFTPVGRLVQGSVAMQQQRDMDTNQPLKDDHGNPVMGTFVALAFPKVLPNGQPNTEFDAMWAQLAQIAAASWPTLFPQGAAGACINPRFSWKYQDGDGVDSNGKSVADKPGFRGNHILRFYTAYPLRCFHEGKFAAHEEIQKPEDVVKRGYWVRLLAEVKSNNATGTQVPGISLFPKLLSFVERGEEIVSGPNAEETLGKTAAGWRPPASASPIPGPGGVPAALPTPPAVSVPTPGGPTVAAPPAVTVAAPPAVSVPTPGGPVIPTPPAAPGPIVSPAMAAQGITWPMLVAQGWNEGTARAAGYIV